MNSMRRYLVTFGVVALVASLALTSVSAEASETTTRSAATRVNMVAIDHGDMRPIIVRGSVAHAHIESGHKVYRFAGSRALVPQADIDAMRQKVRTPVRTVVREKVRAWVDTIRQRNARRVDARVDLRPAIRGGQVVHRTLPPRVGGK
jgi:hypothetical protein